jgi:hypothetical protein
MQKGREMIDEDVKKGFRLLDDVVQAMSVLIHTNHDQIVTLSEHVITLNEEIIGLQYRVNVLEGRTS